MFDSLYAKMVLFFLSVQEVIAGRSMWGGGCMQSPRMHPQSGSMPPRHVRVPVLLPRLRYLLLRLRAAPVPAIVDGVTILRPGFPMTGFPFLARLGLQRVPLMTTIARVRP